MGAAVELQHRVKRALKPLLLHRGRAPRRVRFGPARGVVLSLDRQTGLQVELGLYESELHGVYRRHIRPGSLVWDVGAADGATTLLYAKLGARVVSWEPDPATLAAFDENLALNPALAARIEVVRAAFSPAGAAARPDFVKVDVEGAELDVLADLPAAGVVLVETHSAELEKRTLALLRERGYAVRVIRNAGWRRVYPEYRPIAHNRWLLAVSPGAAEA